MARLSLFSVLMTATVSGCVDPPPEYEVPSLVPPVIVMSRVDPPTTGVTAIPASDTSFTFNVPFRADDDGQDLYANFILDFDPIKVSGAIQFEQPVPSDPRPFAEQIGSTAANSRSVSWTWIIPRPLSECHALTMILTHLDNLNGAYATKDDLQAAQVTWFLDMLDATGSSHACGPPTSSGSSQ